MRDTTECPEGVDAGTLRLVGTDEENVFEAVMSLLTNYEVYWQMECAHNPYGDARASEKIADVLWTEQNR